MRARTAGSRSRRSASILPPLDTHPPQAPSFPLATTHDPARPEAAIRGALAERRGSARKGNFDVSLKGLVIAASETSFVTLPALLFEERSGTASVCRISIVCQKSAARTRIDRAAVSRATGVSGAIT